MYTSIREEARGILTTQRAERYLAAMDATGVQTVVNLDRGRDERLNRYVKATSFTTRPEAITYRVAG